MSGMYPEDFPEGPVAGIADDEVEDFLANLKTDRADRIADRLRDEVAEHSEVTDSYDDFGLGYIAGLKRALHLLENDR
jgi:hypothetical protein